MHNTYCKQCNVCLKFVCVGGCEVYTVHFISICYASKGGGGGGRGGFGKRELCASYSYNHIESCTAVGLGMNPLYSCERTWGCTGDEP